MSPNLHKQQIEISQHYPPHHNHIVNIIDLHDEIQNIDQILPPNIELNQLETRDHSRYQSSWLVYGATLSAHMASIIMGSTFGWNAPAMEEMNENFIDEKQWHSPLVPTDQEKRLISSILTIGAMLGGLLCGLFIDRFGRRKTLMSLGLPYGIGWLCIAFARSTFVILVGRVINGLGIGIAIATVPTYLAEIATPNNRGYIGMSFNFFVVFGIVYMDIINILNFHWNQLALWALLPTALLVITMYFMPESPTWCMNCVEISNDALRLAELNLRRLRTKESDIHGELRDLCEFKNQIQKAKKNRIKLSFQSIQRSDIYKPMLIAIFALFFQQFSGINGVQFYMNDIFAKSGSNLNAKLSTLISNGFMLMATIVGALVIDRFGRRILLMFSALGMALSIGVLGFYYYQHPELAHDYEGSIEQTNSWLPIICVSIFVSSFSFGVGPIAWVIITEITPPQTVWLISSISSIFAWIWTFIIVNETQSFFILFKEYGTYWIFSSISFICIIFAYCLPETKGKTMEEIRKIFHY
ncbi:hypothetical protein HUG17_9894 [Dermatophagoides farinae]|uniref:Major facilitator superfamily (MFS) profile domain-containing protein n=1 Tax=Dermatophagoides farinae TaxID=6954 RepID=A0A9D4P3A2_DERFA|nr:facilitated trehalose transporter Tret1-like [Dermatophagoides farinae]KAH7643203.1 hypothetical protein HUG17_9894 [Dermatophagoides farinae]